MMAERALRRHRRRYIIAISISWPASVAMFVHIPSRSYQLPKIYFSLMLVAQSTRDYMLWQFSFVPNGKTWSREVHVSLHIRSAENRSWGIHVHAKCNRQLQPHLRHHHLVMTPPTHILAPGSMYLQANLHIAQRRWLIFPRMIEKLAIYIYIMSTICRSQGYGLSISNIAWCTHYTVDPRKHQDGSILRVGNSNHLKHVKHVYIHCVYVRNPYHALNTYYSYRIRYSHVQIIISHGVYLCSMVFRDYESLPNVTSALWSISVKRSPYCLFLCCKHCELLWGLRRQWSVRVSVQKRTRIQFTQGSWDASILHMMYTCLRCFLGNFGRWRAWCRTVCLCEWDWCTYDAAFPHDTVQDWRKCWTRLSRKYRKVPSKCWWSKSRVRASVQLPNRHLERGRWFTKWKWRWSARMTSHRPPPSWPCAKHTHTHTHARAPF